MSAPHSPSGEEDRDGRGLPGALTLVIAATLTIHVIVAASLHLTEDEAYYRLWSMSPAFGYFDHPPMIAWWVWLGRHIVGDDPLGVRLAPIVSSAAISALVFDIARLVGAGHQTATRAGVWYNAMILVAAGGLLAVPDSAATLFWTLTSWCALRASRDRALTWWLAAGVVAGLAALSKYSSLFLAPGVFLWLVGRPETRKHLATPGPWLALAAALLIFGLNVVWNAEHHWLTFIKQFGRVSPRRLAPGHLATFLAAQFVLINPLIAIFVVRALADAGRRRQLAVLVATSAPFLIYLTFHSLHDSVQAHWPAPLYPALAICAAVAADADVKGAWTALRRAAPWVGFAVYPLGLCLMGAPGAVTGRLAAPILGWSSFARRLEAERVGHQAAWIGTLSYGLDAQLSDERIIGAPVFQLSERDRYAGLALPMPDFSRPGLLVDLTRRVDQTTLRRCFRSVTALAPMRRVESSTPAKTYAVFIVANPTVDLAQHGCTPMS